jgi:TolB-like protein/Tfp pilus assembly protein PilF
MSDSSKAVFLSYAREDAEAAQRIADALRGFGLEVWFDQSELRGGDQWDEKIRGQIKACALFIPVISQTTQARDEAYFRLEWKLAEDRTHLMAPGKAFIVPVVIDDTPENTPAVPDSFKKSHWTRLSGGEPTSAFIEQVKRLLDGPRKPTLKSGQPKPPTLPPGFRSFAQVKAEEQAAAAKVGRRVPAAAWILALVAVAVLVAGGLLWRRGSGSATEAGAGTRPPTAATVNPAPSSLIPSPAAVRVADKSIAVLPFTNMSEDKDASGFFSDGMQEDILTNLAFIRELRVVSRTSVMGYRGTTKPMRQIAEELGVAYILEGSVRRVGNKVRVTGQLIHAATDEHVWAQAYDRDITDVFAIQAELSQNIAAALKTVLSPEEKVLITRRPTSVPAAYDLYLQARDIGNRGANTINERKRRIEALEKAVMLDPSFAQAWGDLAAGYAYGHFTNDPGMEELLARAKAAIDRAVALAPEDPDIIGAQGYYYYYAFRDYARANEFYEKLARLQPNSPVVFNSLALIQRRQGRWAESLANSRRASELDPSNLSYLRNLIATLRAGRRWDDALTVQRRIVALLPDDYGEKATLAYIPFLATGSTAEGDALLASVTREQADSPDGILIRRNWAASKGDYQEAVRLSKLMPYYDGNGVPRWRQAAVQASFLVALGDKEAAKVRLGDFPTEVRGLLAKEPNNLIYIAVLADMEAMLGHKDEALRLAERYVALMPESKDALDGASYAVYRAAVYDGTGEKEKALAEYTRLLRVPSVVGLNVHEMKRDSLSALRGDPRYKALLNDPKNNAPLF